MPFLIFLSRLPLPLLYGLSTVIYLIIYYLVRYRRDVVAKNLSNAFPELSIAERKQREKRFYKQTCDVLVEAIKSSSLNEADFKKRVVFENPEIFDASTASQQSVIILAAHHCNWEWLLPAANIALPFPVDAVYKPLHQDFADDFMNAARSRFGAKPIPHKSAIMDIMQRRKEQRAFAMVADQAPQRKEDKYWTQFLNQESSFQVGMAKIAQMTKYPVYFANMRRTAKGYYAVRFELLAEAPYAKGDQSLIENYARAAERMILAQPEAWLWANNKWGRPRGLYE